MNNYIIIFTFLCATVCVNSEITCGEGEFYVKRSRRRRSARSGCRPCISGHWQRDSAHTHKSCQPCPSGKYTSDSGASTCVGGPTCKPGTVGIIGAISENETYCKECTPGRYSDTYGDGPECQSCPSGRYTDESKTTLCKGDKACPAGKYGSMFNTKQGVCYNCSVGKITVKDGLFKCSVCPSGQYQLHEGQSSCNEKEECSRWKIHQTNAYECIYLYNMDLYIPLLVLSWISTILAVKVLWVSMEPCISFPSALVCSTLGVSIWLSTKHPINMDGGLSDASFGCLMTFAIITIVGCINYILIDMCGDNYISECDNKKSSMNSISIKVQTTEKASV